MKRAVLASAVVLGAALPLAAQPQAFPSRAVTLVVPFTPGSGSDTIARIITPKLAWDPLESTCRHASLSIL